MARGATGAKGDVMTYTGAKQIIMGWRKQSAHPWRTDTPPVGTVVEVWHLVGVILAVWRNGQWRTTEGTHLPDVTHWRERS